MRISKTFARPDMSSLMAVILRNCYNYWLNSISGQRIQLVQKKKTIFPEWNTCFDAHLYDGRVIQLVVMQRPNKLIADVNIRSQYLAEKCADGGVASVWVSEMEIDQCIHFKTFMPMERWTYDYQ